MNPELYCSRTTRYCIPKISGYRIWTEFYPAIGHHLEKDAGVGRLCRLPGREDAVLIQVLQAPHQQGGGAHLNPGVEGNGAGLEVEAAQIHLQKLLQGRFVVGMGCAHCGDLSLVEYDFAGLLMDFGEEPQPAGFL